MKKWIKGIHSYFLMRSIRKSQRTFVFCQCGNEMIGDISKENQESLSFVRDVYIDNRNVVHFKCSKCRKDNFFDFDHIAPICLPAFDGDDIVEKYKKEYFTFEAFLWERVNWLLHTNQETAALVYLYESLIDELSSPEKCDDFLKVSIGMPMNTDVAVHILNALYPARFKLKHWNDFRRHASIILKGGMAEEKAELILKHYYEKRS